MFPFSTVVECPQEHMLAKIGPMLVGTVFMPSDRDLTAPARND